MSTSEEQMEIAEVQKTTNPLKRKKLKLTEEEKKKRGFLTLSESRRKRRVVETSKSILLKYLQLEERKKELEGELNGVREQMKIYRENFEYLFEEFDASVNEIGNSAIGKSVVEKELNGFREKYKNQDVPTLVEKNIKTLDKRVRRISKEVEEIEKYGEESVGGFVEVEGE